jgi:hypothetical protein
MSAGRPDVLESVEVGVKGINWFCSSGSVFISPATPLGYDIVANFLVIRQNTKS